MKIRFGTYTTYKNYDLRLIEQNDSYRLIYAGTKCPFDDFLVYVENIYYKDLLKEEISNAFFIKTLGIYKGYQFDVCQLNQKNLIGIVDLPTKTGYQVKLCR